jgi:hypothetical protein
LIVNLGGRLLISYDYEHDPDEEPRGGINFAAMNGGRIIVYAGGELGIAGKFQDLDNHVLLIGTPIIQKPAHYRLATGNIEIRIVNSKPIFTLTGSASARNEHPINDPYLPQHGAFVNADDTFIVAAGSTLNVDGGAILLVLGKVEVIGTGIITGGATPSPAIIVLASDPSGAGEITAGNLYSAGGVTSLATAEFEDPDGPYNLFMWAGTRWERAADPPP